MRKARAHPPEMDDDAQPECFVCAEDASAGELIAGVCACTDRFVHLHCQRRLLETCEREGKCTVCLKPYTNMKTRTVRRWNHERFLLLGMYSVLFPIGVIMAILMVLDALHVHRETNEYALCASPNRSAKARAACTELRRLPDVVSAEIEYHIVWICITMGIFALSSHLLRRARAQPVFVETIVVETIENE